MLVTGGAGYIGSHAGKALRQAGYRTVIFDNLSAGHREAALGSPIIEGDIRDMATVEAAVAKADPEVVFHLAAQPLVRLSYDTPVETFATNVQGTVHVLDACQIGRAHV